MTDTTTFIDLDAVAPSVTMSVKLGGVVHELKQATVQDFIDNTRAIQNMKVDAGLEEEMKFFVDMLTRAFPTMTPETLYGLEVDKLAVLLEKALGMNGQRQAEDLAAQAAEVARGEGDAGNPKAAA